MKRDPMIRKHHPVLHALAVLLIFCLLVGQATQQQGAKKPKGTKSVDKGITARMKADSLAAAARADSIRGFAEKAAADSMKAAREAALAKESADSLKTFVYRRVKNEAFGVGERLVFTVNYGFITAGEAVMEVSAFDSVAGRQCYRIEFRVNSLPSFAWIYKVDDHYLTYIDVESIAPHRFEQHIREGNYVRDFTAEFDQARNVAKTSEGTFPTPPYVHDIVSAFYFARTIDFTRMNVGDQVVLSNFYKDKSYELAVKFLGRQELEVDAGTFNTIVVEPLVKEGGLFKSDGRIVIWLSDDDRKLPVRVNTKVVIGSIDTELREYTGVIGPVAGRKK